MYSYNYLRYRSHIGESEFRPKVDKEYDSTYSPTSRAVKSDTQYAFGQVGPDRDVKLRQHKAVKKRLANRP
jgi:hypothetical protein